MSDPTFSRGDGPAATAAAPNPGEQSTAPGAAREGEPVPAQVGRYAIVGEIAHGGMGVVYRAKDPQFNRDVAVKLMRVHYRKSPGAVRRFLDEATITGQLQHPSVPPVFEAGTLPDGSPFLAMKLIKGQTLEALLASGRREPAGGSPDRPAHAGRSPELLGVFEAVCQAVGYAHAHGVVHRDLKPANVMVGAFGEVQVMDWGLAKVLSAGGRPPAAADPDATRGTEIVSTRDADSGTQAGSLLGTPAFMPPEQAIGAIDEIDARSDVFGLGAILCAILTGYPPYVGPDAEAVRKMAVRGELDGAFARLAGCGADPELVALCRRCLAARREDRPADAGAVARAVAALRAAADDRARRAEVAGARWRVLVRAAAAVAAVLAAGAGVSLWQAVRATDAERATAAQLELTQQAEGKERAAADLARRREAEATAAEAAANAARAEAVAREQKEKAARASAEAVAKFMRLVFAGEGTAGEAGRNREFARKRTVKEAMDQAAKTIEGRFGDRPDVEAAVRDTIGKTYVDLGAYAEAMPQLERALDLRETALGPDHPDTLASVNNLAYLLDAKGEYAAAEPLYRRALAGKEKALGPDHPDTLLSVNNLAALLRARGDRAAAEPLYRRALAGYEKALGPDHPNTLASVHNLAGLLYAKGDRAAAEPLYKRALAGWEKALGPDHPHTLMSVHNLAGLLLEKGEYAAAEPLYRRALAGKEKALGPDHPSTLLSVNNLAALLRARGDRAAAEPLYRRALAGTEKALGPDHPNTLVSVGNLAGLYVELRRYADAVPLLDRAARGSAKRPEMAGRVPAIRAYLGLALLGDGQPAAAEPHLLAGHDALTKQKTLSPTNRNRLRAVAAGLAEVYEKTGRPAKAAEWRSKLAGLPPEVAPRPRPAE